MPIENKKAHNKRQQEKWEQIIRKQEEILAFLDSEREMKKEQLIQLGSKEKVVSNYINLQNESAFVRKNY